MSLDPWRGGQIGLGQAAGALTGFNALKGIWNFIKSERKQNQDWWSARNAEWRQAYRSAEKARRSTRRRAKYSSKDFMPKRGRDGNGASYKRTRSYGKFRKGYDRRVGYYHGGRARREKKFWDLEFVRGALNTAGTIEDSINEIPQGAGENQRIGRLAIIKNIGMRYTITNGGSTGAGEAFSVRVMLVLDTQANGAAAAVTDILDGANFQDWNNLVNKGRFIVLMDRIHNVQPTPGSGNAVATGNSAHSFEFHKKCSIPIEFSAATGAMTEIKSNNLLLLDIQDNTVQSTGIKYNIRLRFYD